MKKKKNGWVLPEGNGFLNYTFILLKTNIKNIIYLITPPNIKSLYLTK
jgi:hypothetical protein